MGVVLTPIVRGEAVTLDAVRGRRLAVDGNGELYQFLALIRLRDGTPLRDPSGRVTSHLSGLFFRVTRLIAEYGVQLVFVFDGAPPARSVCRPVIRVLGFHSHMGDSSFRDIGNTFGPKGFSIGSSRHVSSSK